MSRDDSVAAAIGQEIWRQVEDANAYYDKQDRIVLVFAGPCGCCPIEVTLDLDAIAAAALAA